MKKQLSIAIFFAAIMLLVPFTVAAAQKADVLAIKKRNFITKLTTEEIEQICAEFKDMVKDNSAIYQAVEQAFNDAVITSRNGVATLDLVKFGDILAPALERECELLLDNQQKAGLNSLVTSKVNVVGGDRLLLNMQQTKVSIPAINYGNDPSVNGEGPWLWIVLRKLIPSLPPWRYDNDDNDVDGPAEEGPDDGYKWKGLDDHMDWNFVEDMIEHGIPLWMLFTIAGLIGSVVSIGVLLLWLIPFQAMCGFTLILFVFEAFDVKDLSYGFPGNTDGL